MHWFQTTYALRFATGHQLVGHVFQGRYKSPIIGAENGDYFRTVSEYIHLNPARSNLLNPSAPVLADYRWSSYPFFLASPSSRPEWLRFDRLAEHYGLDGDTPQSRLRFRHHLERRARECVLGNLSDTDLSAWQSLRGGWCFGSEEFRDEMFERLGGAVGGKKRASFEGTILRGHDERQARGLIQEAANRLGLDLKQLRSLRKNDPRKQALAWLVRSRTAVRCEWISRELNMGSRVTIYQAVRRFAGDRLDEEARELLRRLADLTI